MSKTWLTVVTALVLGAASLGLIFCRWQVLGAEIDGTPGAATWKVTLELSGDWPTPDTSLTTILPPDFRRQHIMDEELESEHLSWVVRTRKDGGQRRAVWQRRQAPAGAAFRFTYAFRCILGMRRPTSGMALRSHVLDAPPVSTGPAVKRAPSIESDHAEITVLAQSLDPTGGESGERIRMPPEERVRALFNYVADLPDGPEGSALHCLREGSGNAAAKSRLLVALCRNRQIPARILHGLVLEKDGQQEPHAWVEAWVAEHWLAMDPDRHRFGMTPMPDNYLVLHIGEQPRRGGKLRAQATYTAIDLHNSLGEEGAAPPSAARRVWRKLSLANLRPEEQVWVKFLLLLPVGALIVCVFRTVIGLTTFGTFGPALLGLVCRDLKDFPWAMGFFVALLLSGWGMRLLLDRYHLLLVPRISVVLTAVILFLIAGMVLVGPYGGATRGYLAFLPLIILTHMVERFWTVEAEDGAAASFKTLLSTVTVAVVIMLLVNFDVVINGLMQMLGHGPVIMPDVVRRTLFRFPEALGLVLAAQLLLGRYTGYRLTELFRFRDLLLEEVPPGGTHELAAAHHEAAHNGHPGDESAQHRVHPGPQPAVVLSPGGQQEANARPVPVDRSAYP